ncbi:terpenoid cyclases/protein prenyltransferase alpha-alpha toroid [Mycena maculata]|uniref:Terpene cyclase/mutase family member n=1 Tax=Mycena maculata TaxID=230809 RepID=A0AAD7JVD4_9AGAR|nr:terpenoid cyclases/protein prenyltransferase alpha-alpha toroid [Mycena maculata]
MSIPSTGHSRWRLKLGPGGSHAWQYLESDEQCAYWPQTDIDRYWLGIPVNLPALPTARDALDAAQNGLTFLKNLQAPDGHFPGEYGGPMFLLPGVVIGSYIAGAAVQEQERRKMIKYLLNTAHPKDGGWGMGTLLRLGGTTASPSWGKFWMTVLGCLVLNRKFRLLPSWVPVHPGRWWIQTRMIFLPMSYLYRVRFQAKETPLILALREEIYTTPYKSISWPAQRNIVAAGDVYAPHTRLLDFMNLFLQGTLEACPFPPLQRRALQRVYSLICMEDENIVPPVSKIMNMLCRIHAEGRDSEAVARHVATRNDVVTGTNGSQLWDTAFAAQALVEIGLADVQDNPKHYHTAYRQGSKGAWAFSTKEQGYTLTDCTGEALKAILYLQNRRRNAPKLISDARIFDAVNLLMSMQCSDGGFGSYEVTRAPQFLESFNAAEVLANTMVEHTYPECTTCVITALRISQNYYLAYRKKDIDLTIRKAIKYLHGQQRQDGSWYGSWGTCFTYATMFALESLALVGETYASSARVKRACEFLLSKQMPDDGWGESYKSCEEERYIHHEHSQVVQTSWAAMALMYGRYPDTAPIGRAVSLVRSRQLPDGQWAQEAVEGIFNKTCTTFYPNLKLIFTIWMLGLAHKYIEGLE